MKQMASWLTDMHAHICSYEDPELARQEIRLRRREGILTCFSTGTPQEWEWMDLLLGSEKARPDDVPLWLSFGIHPWYSDQFDPRKWTDLYKRCSLIGEIGMDALWCDVPLVHQKKVLEIQLQMAADLHKPVVLHTKDCEEQIAEIIRGFPCPVLVHWYSGGDGPLKTFLDQGCFFTLGPDTSLIEQSMLLRMVPRDLLLTETDGIEAVRWAYEEYDLQPPDSEDLSLIPKTLSASLRQFAKRFGMQDGEARQQILQNLHTLMAG